MKEYILSMFPGIERFWNLDGGKTVLTVYFRLQEIQLMNRRQWRDIKKNSGLMPYFAVSFADSLLIRLVPYEYDERKPFTDGVMNLLDVLLEGNGEKQKHLDRVRYLRMMEITENYKIDDRLNGMLMTQEIMLHILREGIFYEQGQKFEAKVETGEIMEGEIIAVIEVDGKEYAVYTLPGDKGSLDILASYVQKDEDGFDQLVDIDNAADKDRVDRAVKKLLRTGQLVSLKIN